MNKKILITGSGGFIFSNFIRKALYKKIPYKIVSLDACKGPKAHYNLYVNKSHTFYTADLTDARMIDVIFEAEKPDYVIHGAAQSFVDHSINSATPFVQDNVLATQVVIDACLKHKVEKLIYISTDEVYGQLTDPEAPAWTEDQVLAPRNPYSATKAAGELLVKAAHQTHGLNYNITRCCNNFGPRQPPRNLIPKVIRCILNGEPIPVFGQGLQRREWLYVDDNYRAIMTILEKGEPNQSYNISSGSDLTNLEIINKIASLMGKGTDLITFVPDRKGHDFRYSVDSAKLQRLGWVPKYSLDNGLTRTVNWYQKNLWFLKE